MSHRDGLLCVGGPRHGAWVAHPERVMKVTKLLTRLRECETEGSKPLDFRVGRYQTEEIPLPLLGGSVEVWAWTGWEK